MNAYTPMLLSDITRTVDVLGERQATTIARFGLRRPNQPLTRAECARLADGSATRIGALFSATDEQVDDRLYQMFGGAK